MTGTTPIYGIRYPDNATKLKALGADLALMGGDIERALQAADVPPIQQRAWLYAATLAALKATSGTQTWDRATVTNDPTPSLNGDYVLHTSGWVKLFQTGEYTPSSSNGNSAAPVYWGDLQTVTFPTPFPTTPHVTAHSIGYSNSSVGWVYIGKESPTGFTYRELRINAAPLLNTIRWRADFDPAATS
jgi:hypothetical protein